MPKGPSAPSGDRTGLHPRHGNQRLILRPGTQRDYLAFYGKPPLYSAKTLVADLDGTIIGVAGIEYRRGFLYAFSDLTPEIRQFRKALVRAGDWLLRQMIQAGVPVAAVANPNEPTAQAFLTRIGFVHVGATVDGEVYEWRKLPSR